MLLKHDLDPEDLGDHHWEILKQAVRRVCQSDGHFERVWSKLAADWDTVHTPHNLPNLAVRRMTAGGRLVNLPDRFTDAAKRIATLAYYMQRLQPEKDIALPTRTIAALVGLERTAASYWIRALVNAGVLEKTAKHSYDRKTNRRRAARYRYTGPRPT